MNEQKNYGITLISLIVTIIVLLILSGVSIATLSRTNGLINQANEAKTSTNKSQSKERIQAETLRSFGTNGTINETILRKNLKNIDGIVVGESSFPIEVTLDSDTFEISNTGEVTEK